MLTLNPTEEPTYTLNVSGKELSFLVDTGATRSIIAVKELPRVEKSRNSAQVVGLGGKIQTLDTTTQLPVRCGPLQEKHAILLTTSKLVSKLVRSRFAMKVRMHDSEGCLLTSPQRKHN